MQQSAYLCFSLIDPLPLGYRNFFGSIAAPSSRKSVLKRSRWMPEEAFIFFAFCANIEAHRGLFMCPIHRWPVSSLYDEARLLDGLRNIVRGDIHVAIRRRRDRTSRLAPAHGYDSGADHFQHSVRAQDFQEAIDLVLSASDLDGE